MMDLLARKSSSGDVSFHLAQSLLASHEWGLALKALDEGIKKGQLSDPEQAQQLLNDIRQRLGIRGSD